VIFFYLAINGVYLYLFPAAEIAHRDLIAGDVMKSLFGPAGEKVITVIILTCIFGVFNTVILAGGRIPYAVGKDHALLRWLGGSTFRFQTPDRSLVVNALWASILVGWGTFSRLLFLSAAAVWLFFAMTGVSLFMIRVRFRGRKRPFSAWGYPWTAIVFTVASFWIFLNTALFSPRETVLGFSIIALGIPLYWISSRLEPKR
jgi:amino acid transporter